MSTDPGATTLLDLSGEKADPYLNQVRSVVQLHLDIANRLSKQGSPLHGFQELVRASRAVPMNARLAAAITRLALQAGTHAVALTLINDGVEDADGREKLDVLRQLARLARHADDLDRAQEVLSTILALQPEDRRARAVLNALLARRQAWDELDASLDKETREALRRGKLRAASRSALRRARLWGETLDDPSRAALRAMQAAQYAEQGKDLQSAFVLRLLWLRNLHRAKAPVRALDDAARVVLNLGDRVGQRASAQSLVDELGLGQDHTDSGDRTVNSVDTTPVVATVNSVSGEKTPPLETSPRRRSTQLELVAVAEVAEQAGRKQEAAAILAAAVRDGPDPRAAQRLESHFIQRGAWRELAAFYRDALQRSVVKAERARWAEKLAELLESELDDKEGAAKAWAEVAAVTGDTRAVSEQVRLLAAQKNGSGVRDALDAGVKQAQAPQERARALVLRAEESLTRREVAQARTDFEAALKLVPHHPEAAAGLAELSALQNDPAPIRALEQALGKLAKHSPGRGDLYRRLARLSDSPLRDARLSRLAWGEVLAELPTDEEASLRLLALTRAAGDDVALEKLITDTVTREPRGPRARMLRMELVTLLERAGREGEALEALKQAVRMEPGHREGWLAYAERLISLGGRDGEAAWALEHAATATDDPAQRHKLWLRLARFVREQLGDEARAQTFETRAEKLQREHPELAPVRAAPIRARPDPYQTQPLPPAPEPLPGGPLVIPSRRSVKPRISGPQLTQAQQDAFEKLAEKLGARVEADDKSRSHVRVAPRVAKALAEMHKEPLIPPRPGPPVPDLEPAIVPFEEDDDEPVAQTSELPVDEDELPTPAPAAPAAIEDYEPEEISSEDLEVPDERERLKGPVPQVPEDDEEEVANERRTAELRVELGDPSVVVPPSFGPSPSRALSAERTALFERVRSSPLEADGYKLLAEHFDTANDPARSSLMLEIARALEGDPHAAPRAPRLILNATDRAGLKHPSLRGEGGELLSLVGVALCKLNPARGREAGTDDEFHLEAGKGARAVADSLLAAVRILGLRSPDVFLSEDPGPPLALVFTTAPRIVVGKLAVKKEVTDAELRFFAGRTLFTQQPELMALRSLRRDAVLRGLVLVSQVVEGRASPAETKIFRETVQGKSWDRLKQLVKVVGTRLDLGSLTEGARHSANRAGLVVCGGIAPAIASLRAKKALPSEMMELVRFAASERYLQLRNRNLPRR